MLVNNAYAKDDYNTSSLFASKKCVSAPPGCPHVSTHLHTIITVLMSKCKSFLARHNSNRPTHRAEQPILHGLIREL